MNRKASFISDEKWVSKTRAGLRTLGMPDLSDQEIEHAGGVIFDNDKIELLKLSVAIKNGTIQSQGKFCRATIRAQYDLEPEDYRDTVVRGALADLQCDFEKIPYIVGMDAEKMFTEISADMWERQGQLWPLSQIICFEHSFPGKRLLSLNPTNPLANCPYSRPIINYFRDVQIEKIAFDAWVDGQIDTPREPQNSMSNLTGHKAIIGKKVGRPSFAHWEKVDKWFTEYTKNGIPCFSQKELYNKFHDGMIEQKIPSAHVPKQNTVFRKIKGKPYFEALQALTP